MEQAAQLSAEPYFILLQDASVDPLANHFIFMYLFNYLLNYRKQYPSCYHTKVSWVLVSQTENKAMSLCCVWICHRAAQHPVSHPAFTPQEQSSSEWLNLELPQRRVGWQGEGTKIHAGEGTLGKEKCRQETNSSVVAKSSGRERAGMKGQKKKEIPDAEGFLSLVSVIKSVILKCSDETWKGICSLLLSKLAFSFCKAHFKILTVPFFFF